MILFIFGPDSFRAQQKIAELKKKYLDQVDRLSTSFTEHDGKSLKVDDLSRLFATDSLFVKKRLVQINDVFAHKQMDFISALTEFLSVDHAEHIIIFYDQTLVLDSAKKPGFPVENKKPKALSKDQQKLWQVLSGAYSQYFPILNSAELGRWVESKLKSEGQTISKPALQLLVGMIGGDLWQMNNELDKLISYKLGSGSDRVISLEEVQLLVNHELNQSIFELTDAISNRNKAKAVAILNEQVAQGVADLYLLTMLVRQFRILLGVRQGLDNGLSPKQIGDVLKLNSFVLNKSINQARNFNLSSLTSIMSTLAKIDYRFKTGALKVETMIDILIARL
jgi:DNA polymerase-3 subunit delta